MERNVEIADCYAGDLGGTVFARGSQITGNNPVLITMSDGVRVVRSKARNGAGGMYLQYGTQLIAKRQISFIANDAPRGGALRTYDSGAVVLEDVEFVNNY
eukprot:2482060-Rhodomonas_salina.1